MKASVFLVLVLLITGDEGVARLQRQILEGKATDGISNRLKGKGRKQKKSVALGADEAPTSLRGGAAPPSAALVEVSDGTKIIDPLTIAVVVAGAIWLIAAAVNMVVKGMTTRRWAKMHKQHLEELKATVAGSCKLLKDLDAQLRFQKNAMLSIITVCKSPGGGTCVAYAEPLALCVCKLPNARVAVLRVPPSLLRRSCTTSTFVSGGMTLRTRVT